MHINIICLLFLQQINLWLINESVTGEKAYNASLGILHFQGSYYLFFSYWNIKLSEASRCRQNVWLGIFYTKHPFNKFLLRPTLLLCLSDRWIGIHWSSFLINPIGCSCLEIVSLCIDSIFTFRLKVLYVVYNMGRFCLQATKRRVEHG